MTATQHGNYNGGQVYLVWLLWFVMMLVFRWCFAQKRPLYQYNTVENENSAYFFQAHLPPEEAHELTAEEACIPMAFGISTYADSRTENSVTIEDEKIMFSKDQIIRCVQSNRIVERDLSTQISYFEVKIVSMLEGARLGIGYASKPYPFFRLPGLDRFSIGYHSENGHQLYNGSFFGDDSVLKEGDVVGCGIGNEFEGRQTFFFTLNGVRLPSDMETSELIGRHFATIGCYGGCELEINWGAKPLVYSLQHDQNVSNNIPAHLMASIHSLNEIAVDIPNLVAPGLSSGSGADATADPQPSPPPYSRNDREGPSSGSRMNRNENDNNDDNNNTSSSSRTTDGAGHLSPTNGDTVSVEIPLAPTEVDEEDDDGEEGDETGGISMPPGYQQLATQPPAYEP
eukprot:Nk52_evm43s967 gene=Nk52_evmTU43s967